jgi:hypothetical protein
VTVEVTETALAVVRLVEAARPGAPLVLRMCAIPDRSGSLP